MCLSRITADSKYENLANKIFESASSLLEKNPQAFTHLLSAFDFAFGPSYEIIIAGDLSQENTIKTINELTHGFIPNKVLILVDTNNHDYTLSFNYLKSYSMINSQPTIYVCKNFTCNLPTTDIDMALKQLI